MIDFDSIGYDDVSMSVSMWSGMVLMLLQDRESDDFDFDGGGGGGKLWLFL